MEVQGPVRVRRLATGALPFLGFDFTAPPELAAVSAAAESASEHSSTCDQFINKQNQRHHEQ